MRIIVREADGMKINLIIPNMIVFNNMMLAIYSKAINKGLNKNDDTNPALEDGSGNFTPGEKPKISTRDLIKIKKSIKALHKRYGEFTLIEVEDSNGDYVKITI